MTKLDEVLALYEVHLTTVYQNDNGDWDYDISPLDIKFDLSETDFNPDIKTRKSELATINTLQDLFDKPGWELKNATNGIHTSTILVEHHQKIHNTNEIKESGILISKAGYWWYGIDDIGFIVLKKEFLDWCYEFNLKAKMMKDKPIESQGWNTGIAFLIQYEQLPFLFRKYKETIDK